MNRDEAGEFNSAGEGRPRQTGELSLPQTTWQLLEQQAQALGVSCADLVERYARYFQNAPAALLDLPQAAPRDVPVDLPIEQPLEPQSSNCQLEALPEPLSAGGGWLEVMLDWLPTPLILVDPTEKRVTFSNRAANAIAGVDLVKDVGAVYGDDYFCTDASGQKLPPEQLPALRAARGEKIQGLEIRWHTPVGVFPLLVYADTLPAMHNRPPTSVVLFQDIRHRKALEEQLRESQRFTQQVADAIPGVLYVYDLIEQRNVHANRQVGEVLGYSMEQIQAMGEQLFPGLMHPDDLATLPAHLERFQRAQPGELVEREYRMRHADGTWRWLWSRDLVFSRTAAGAPQQVVGISHDITDRKQAEIAAASAADRTARLQSLTAALSEALTPADVATVIVEQALAALGAGRGAMALVDATGTALEIIRFVGYAPGMMSSWQRFPLTADLPMAQVVRSQTPLFLPSLGDLLAAYPKLAHLQGQIPPGAIAIVPLMAEGEVLGALSIGFAEAHPINETDRAFIFTLARQCAQAIRRAQLYQAEQAAREIAEASEQRFRFLAESIPQMVWVAQPNGFTEYYNQRWFQYTGLTLEESQNANGSFRHPDDNEHFAAAWIKAVTNKEPFQAEQRIRGADGQYRWHLSRAYPLLDEAGEILKWFGSCTDIDDWKKLYQQAEQARLQAEENAERTARLQAVTAALSESLTPVQVAEVVAQQTIAVLDAAAVLVALLTPQRDELEIIHHLGSPSVIEPAWQRFPLALATPLSDAVRNKQPMWETTLEDRMAQYPHLAEIYAKLEYPVWISLPLVVEGQALGGMTITFKELPRLKPEDRALMLSLTQQCAQAIARAQLYEAEQQARAQAEAANRMKDEFLAVLSHELRTPMNPILGWSKLLRDGKLPPNRTATALETIERNARLQVQLIEDLLDVSRILQGKLSLHSAAVNLAAIITAAIETVGLAADAKGLPIQTRLTDSPDCQVLGDAARLQQVVWNLLSNAVKFTPTGGHVEVRLEYGQMQGTGAQREAAGVAASSCARACAQIIVSDTGKGISPEFLPYVFDTFRQADSSTTRLFGGLGLGLAISRHIVELHGGTIEAASPGEGQGATFTVTLPLLAAQVHPNQEPMSTSNGLTLQGLGVLVVDDEADNLELVTFILEEVGASSVAVSSAQAALEYLGQIESGHPRPDVLLADIGLPQMDGYRLLKQIRLLEAEQGHGPMPAIALTAYVGETDRERALAAGFQHHLPKPVEPEVLVKAILSCTPKD